MNELIKIKPLCDNVIKHPTIKNINALLLEIQQLNGKTLQVLQDYILLPLVTQIDNDNYKNSNELKFHLIATITELMRVTQLRKIIPLKIIIVVLLKQIFDPKNAIIYPDLSEEFKLAIVECLGVCFRHTVADVLVEFYTIENHNILAQIVFVSTHILDSEKYRKLRISSVECLMASLNLHDKAEFEDIVLRDQISDQVFVMLPKIVATLQKVALGDEKQGQALISISIKALGRILCLVFQNYQQNDLANEQVSCKLDDFRKLINSNETISKPNLTVLQQQLKKKTAEWLFAAIQKLAPIVEKLKRLIGHPNERIRMELVDFTVTLLRKCKHYMKQTCLPHLLEILISLSQDPDGHIAEKCRNYMKDIKMIEDDVELNILETILYSHLIKLPRILYVGDESEKVAALLLINGLLDVLSANKLKIILTTSETMEKFIAILLAAVELEQTMDLLQDEHSIRTINDNDFVSMNASKRPWRRFRNLSSVQLIEQFEKICSVCGESNCCDLIFNFLLDLFAANTSSCNEILILFQMLLVCKNVEEEKLDSDLIGTCLGEIIKDIHWDLTIQANQTTDMQMEEFGATNWYEDRTHGLYESAISIRYTDVRWTSEESPPNNIDTNIITINDAKFNVLHTCLVLETMGFAAMQLREQFQQYLLKSLHLVLEKAGSSNYMIHMAGLMALNNFKIGLGYDNVSQLIHTNSDYIAYYINISLKKEQQSKMALDILSVVLKYSSLESIPHLENIIQTVLLENSKSNQLRNISSFLKVFQMILYGIRSWSCPDKVLPVEMMDESSPIFNRDNWIEQLEASVQMERQKEQEDRDLVEEDLDDGLTPEEIYEQMKNEKEKRLNDNESNEEEEKVEEKPKHIQLTIVILQRCIKFIATKNKMDKCVVLETICCGLNVIKSYENELLPMVHAVWPPFVERLKETDPVILRRCFELLFLLAKLSKDFIYKRTEKEIFPFVITFLKKSATESLRKNRDISYEHSQQFKFQQELLQQLPELITNLDITERNFDDILNATLDYLRADQPVALQQSCLLFMQTLGRQFDGAAIVAKLSPREEDEIFKLNVKNIFNKLL